MENSTERLEIHVPVKTTGDLPVDLLHRACGLSRQRIKSAMEKGAVWITRGRNTQRLRRVKRALRAGDEVHLYYDPRILATAPPEPELLADVGGYSVWHKPCGMYSQGSKWGDHCSIVRWAGQHLEPDRSTFTVHRLDRAANGIILVAHARKVAASLSALFHERKITKRYYAVVAGNFCGYSDPLRVDQPIDGRHAVSEVSLLEYLPGVNRSVVEVQIETGRKHQIRRHLAGLGHPIVGDRLYGAGETDGVDLQLTAYLLAFHCPVDNEPVEYRLRRAFSGRNPAI